MTHNDTLDIIEVDSIHREEIHLLQTTNVTIVTLTVTVITTLHHV